MKNLSLLFLLIMISNVNHAQSFVVDTTGVPFTAIKNGAMAFSDIDGDNDQDLLITGETNFYGIAKLYTNDGNGDFTEVIGTPFDSVTASSIDFADIDGDNDQDVLIAGFAANNFTRTTKLFTNDGNGNFSEVLGTPFLAVTDNGSVTFADVDNDNDQDVLITGGYYGIVDWLTSSKLYLNDGSGTFTEVSTPFVNVAESDVVFFDMDNDNDQDVLISGLKFPTNAYVTALYANDGNGNFSQVTNTAFSGVMYSSVDVADIDGDNDLDILLAGLLNSNPTSIIKLYANDGNGNFSEVVGTPFNDVINGDCRFLDIEGDNDSDILITGFSYSVGETTELYTNDGNGNFTLAAGMPFITVRDSRLAVADVNGDNAVDILVSGFQLSPNTENLIELYSNTTLQVSSDDLKSTNENVLIYPNPVQNELLIDRLENIESILIYNQLGQQLQQVKINDSFILINVQDFPKGNYVVEFIQKNGIRFSKQFIK